MPDDRPPTGGTLLRTLLCLLPLALLVVAFIAGWPVPWWLVFLLLLVFCGLMHRSGGSHEHEGEGHAGCGMQGRSTSATTPEADTTTRERAARIADGLPWQQFQVRGWSCEPAGIVIRGRLRGSAEDLIAEAEEAVRADIGADAVVSLTESGDGADALLITGPELGRQLRATAPRRRPGIALGLFAATILTTIIAGAAHQGVNLYAEPGHWRAGLPYALGLLLILGVHESGHFFAARRHGIQTSFPYFIPVPFALGTFGAFISMPPLLRDRRQIFDIGVAGPLAGLLVAVPALAIGLQWSEVIPAAEAAAETVAGGMHGAGLDAGSSLLMALVAKFALGEALLEGHLIQLHPLAFAGWLGLMITALNLIPVGQLDGGHIAYALFGPRRARQVGTGALIALVLLALFVYPGLLFWAFIIFFLAGGGRFPARDDLTPLSGGRRLLAWTSYAILVLILAPLPHAWFGAVGLHCPYL